MQFIKPDVNIDFIGKRKIAFGFSGAMIIISIISLILHGGPKLGVDFQGGTLIQVKFQAPVNIADIKTGMRNVGIDKASVQRFGEKNEHEYLIRTDSSLVTTKGSSAEMKKALDEKTGGNAEIQRVEMGPAVYHHLYIRTFRVQMGFKRHHDRGLDWGGLCFYAI